jgi:DNA repair protein RadC
VTSVNEMTARYGITPARAYRLKAAIELGRRAHLPSELSKVTIRKPEDAVSVLQPNMGHLEQETLWILLLNTRNMVVDLVQMYRGQINRIDIRVADVFREPIRQNAHSIVVAHNHPSGDPAPSPEDVQITKTMVDMGDQLGIDVMDHIIVAGTKWVSLRERGLGFAK